MIPYRSSNHPDHKAEADLILTGGKIYTGDESIPWVEAVAIKNGRFCSVGSQADAMGWSGTGSVIHDLGGRFCMPGLYDMHTHPDLALGPRYSGYLDVGIDSPTPEEVKTAILKYAADNPDREWVFGQCFVHFTFKQAGLTPDRDWLDSFIPDRPVAIMDRMWGGCLANSKALEAAGINKDTRDPANGYIERDDLTGEPTGLLIDGAYALIIGAMPPTPMPALIKAYRKGVQYQSSRGVVASKYAHVCEHRLNALKTLDDAGELSLRVEAMISWQDDIFPVRRRWELLAGERHYYRSARLNANAVKFHFDGTAEPRTSYVLEPWSSNNPWRGKLNLTPEHIIAMVQDMDRQGIRVVAHCTGDAASDIFLDAVAEARRANGWDNAVRHQCAHSTVLHDANLERFKKLDVIAEFSPVGWYPEEFAMKARSGFGPERLKRLFNIKGVIDAGGTAVMGTDWPVSDFNPWVGFEAMVTRADPAGDRDNQLGTPISLEQAVKVMTINGAYAMGAEDFAGSITVGKSADMIVVDRNIFDIDPFNSLHRTEVDLTIIEGTPAYDRTEELAPYGLNAVWTGPSPSLDD